MRPTRLGFITVPRDGGAETIARALLEDRLIACANCLDGVQSFFWWEGQIDHAKECLLIIKTEDHCQDAIIKKVKSMHPYTVPEIIFFPLTDGYAPYVKWISDSLKGSVS